METFPTLLALCAGNSPVTRWLATLDIPAVHCFYNISKLLTIDIPWLIYITPFTPLCCIQCYIGPYENGTWLFFHFIIIILLPDSKVHGANMGPSGADRSQVGPCWPHELCYLGCEKISNNIWFICHLASSSRCGSLLLIKISLFVRSLLLFQDSCKAAVLGSSLLDRPDVINHIGQYHTMKLFPLK